MTAVCTVYGNSEVMVRIIDINTLVQGVASCQSSDGPITQTNLDTVRRCFSLNRENKAISSFSVELSQLIFSLILCYIFEV